MGHRAVQPLLNEEVLVEEKVDGSQFSFGIFNGELKTKSRNCMVDRNNPGMFAAACKGVWAIDNLLHPGWTYRAEYLQKPKHNSLAYDRVPKNNLILFDINTGDQHYMSREDKEAEAERLGMEIVPLLDTTQLKTVADLERYLKVPSILGGPMIEGVVLKAVEIKHFAPDGKALIAKFVAPAFKEIHQENWKGNKLNVVEGIIEGLRTERRWEKAVERLRDAGQLESTPKDIGGLVKAVQSDVMLEEEDAIREALWQGFQKDIRRGIVKGVPEWYKERLVAQAFEGGE